MDARNSDAHSAPRSHAPETLSSPPDAEAPATSSVKPYAKPELELYGSVSEITAGSNIFGD